MDAWSTVIGQRTMESICSIARDMEKLPTLRDQFAMAALQGLISCEPPRHSHKEFAEWAYEYADAMLAARKEKK